MRGAVAALLSREEDIEVVAEADGNGEVLARAVSCRPDVVVIDVDSEEGEELAARSELRARLPECRMLLLMASTTPERLRRILGLHAAGVISMNAPADRLVHGVRKLVRGQRFIDPEFALVALDAGENPLTPRDVEILRLAADGTPTREIAERLSLSVATVRNHLSAITRKTGGRNRIDAIRIARESGWV
ncbi:response regulator transcription factor [Streptomyces sp. ISL-22]|uniref:Two-component system response regulator n=1 Tax=Streptomyces curacoi TaxID=146536 RepID=A0A117NTZ9_9ACTN|nr:MULTISPECIES: response regulator transcription factor [unclassified Streptomyces]KUM67379.1 two-component system response regulator [Streptomyces curacoi]MBT2423856.1 response regulator transcription factor [Streptomyces sp. ISL-24]MBT2435761.1 response regulator transcription factor [Streptomyces sp. ISL-22]